MLLRCGSMISSSTPLRMAPIISILGYGGATDRLTTRWERTAQALEQCRVLQGARYISRRRKPGSFRLFASAALNCTASIP